MKYFTIEELCKSDIAKKIGIDNTPSPEIIENLEELVYNVLDPLREEWGGPIQINSGYRCPELNKVVGGAKNSGHLSGWTVDMVPVNRSKEDFLLFIQKFIKEHKTGYDELFYEIKGTSAWIHFAWKSKNGEQRSKYGRIC